MTHTAASRQSMRAFLAALEGAGELRRIPERVDRDFEIAACLAEADGGAALRFDDVGGHALPVVGNLLNALPRIARGLGTTRAALQGKIIAAIDKPLAHRQVASAPCQDVVIPDPVLTEELPIPRFFAGEGGRYITAGAIVARDRRQGYANLSIARLMLSNLARREGR